MKCLYREAKDLTDNNFIISKTGKYGPRMEKKPIENWIYNHRKEFANPDRQKKINPGKKPRVDKIIFHGLRHSYNQNREKLLEGDPRRRQKLSEGLRHHRTKGQTPLVHRFVYKLWRNRIKNQRKELSAYCVKNQR